MEKSDPYIYFKSAFEEHQSKIHLLNERVSKLEKMNSQVLSYVRITGNLPAINLDEAAPKSFIDSVNSEPTQVKSYPNGQDLLFHIVARQATELDKALETFGLEPSKRRVLLDQIQTNLNSILCNELKSAVTSSCEHVDLQLPFPPGEGPFTSFTSATSCGTPVNGDGSVYETFRSQPETSNQYCSPLKPNWSEMDGRCIPGGDTSLCAHGANVAERRYHELKRLNQRLQTTPRSSTNDTLHMGTSVGSSGRNSWAVVTHVPPAPMATKNYSIISSNNCDESSNQPAYKREECVPSAACTKDLFCKPTDPDCCPCGDWLKCPLSPAKRRRFGNDPKVRHGFLLVAAIFRGRFVRQLLATHRVYDLIRTVKDTAKLALSIHVERQACTPKTPECDNSDSHDLPLVATQLSHEEMVLESRLLAQLRGALNQLHEIFFTWPVVNQIELLHVSRSLPQRTKRTPVKSYSSREDTRRLDSQSSDVSHTSKSNATRLFTESKPQRHLPLTRWESSEPQSKVEQLTRVLRQLQLDQINRFSSPIMANQSFDGKTKKHVIPDCQSDGVSLRRQNATVPAVAIEQSQSTTYRKSLRKSEESDDENTGGKLEYSCSITRLHIRTPVHPTPDGTGSQIESVDHRNRKQTTLPNEPTNRARVSVSRTSIVRKNASAAAQCTVPRKFIKPVLFPQKHHSAKAASTTSPRSVAVSSIRERNSDALSAHRGNFSKETVPWCSKDVELQQSSHSVSLNKSTCDFPRRPNVVLTGTAHNTKGASLLSEIPLHSGTNCQSIAYHGVHSPRAVLEGNSSKAQTRIRSSCQPTLNKSHHSAHSNLCCSTKRPISGPLGQRRANQTTSKVTEDWYPVRRRIVASQYPKQVSNVCVSPKTGDTLMTSNTVPTPSCPLKSTSDQVHPSAMCTKYISSRHEEPTSAPINNSALRATWSIESDTGGFKCAH